jgi:uncharacterized membrane protein YuzA (DUF378 family)
MRKDENMETLQKTCLVLTIIGAIVWGLIGIFDWNVVEWLFGDTIIPRLIYTLVGIAGVINIGLLFKHYEDYTYQAREQQPSS